MAQADIIRHSSSYRQGLVLGLTMAEIMLLLIFCLLIALAAYLRFEAGKLSAAATTVTPKGVSPAEHAVLAALKKNPALYEKVLAAAQSSNAKAVDEYWRDLVADQAIAVEVRKFDLSLGQIRQKVVEANALEAKGIDTATAIRDADIVGSIQTAIPNNGRELDPQLLKQIIQKGLQAQSQVGHQWPPIIDLSEANGYYFKTGSAELSPKFHAELATKIPERITELIRQYDVDVIEVVGHTDEQPIGSRPSNLDWDLVPVLRNGTPVASLVPADNAGLGLARAVSVVSVLRQSKLLNGYKLVPLSGAQLVNTDETLALTQTPGDIPKRRRIEIRLRKSSPYDSPVPSHPAGPTTTYSADVTTTADAIPLPRPRPIFDAKPKPRPGHQAVSNAPLSLTQP